MSQLEYISTLIIGAGILLGVFIAFILLRMHTGHQKANKIMAWLMLAFSANILHSVLFSDILGNAMEGYRINEPLQFLLGPIYYFYVRQLTHPNYQFKKRDWIHFLPFILYAFTMLIFEFIALTSGPIRLGSTILPTYIFWGTVILQLTSYGVLAHKNLKLHQIHIKGYYSELGKVNLQWVKYFLVIIVLIYVAYIAILGVLIHNPEVEATIPHLKKVIAIILSFSVGGLGYRALLQPPINAASEPTMSTTNDYENIYHDANSGDISERNDIIDKEIQGDQRSIQFLLDYMDKERPFLNQELTLPQLAEMVSLPRNRLSQLLNEQVGVSFYDFINGYRVKEVQRLMLDPQLEHLKILALAFDAGFNSKATFNNVFKKITGQTPSEYRKQLASR